MALRFTGIDPGLVHTAVVTLEVDPLDKRWGTSFRVFDGLGDDVVDEIKEHTLLDTAVFVEEYKPRSHFSQDNEMISGVSRLNKAIGKAKVISNTGVKKVVRRKVMDYFDLWNWPQVTHHQDLRSAAYILLYGMYKEPEFNQHIYNILADEFAGQPWQQF